MSIAIHPVELLRCTKCGGLGQRTDFTCIHCAPQRPPQEVVDIAGVGSLHSFTQVFVSSTEFEARTPYWLGLVKLQAGPTVLGFLNVDASAAPRLDQDVRCTAFDGKAYTFEAV